MKVFSLLAVPLAFVFLVVLVVLGILGMIEYFRGKSKEGHQEKHRQEGDSLVSDGERALIKQLVRNQQLQESIITDLEEHKRLEDRQLQWAQHAHPLKRLTIEVQGTRHSDKKAMLALVNEVSALLASGEVSGRKDDDDFGYIFEYTPETNQPSIFD